MPALGNISINDATSPAPVAHVFTPRTTNGSDASLRNSAASTIPQGFELLTLKVHDPSATSTTAAYTISGSLVLPRTVTDPGTGAVTVDHSSKIDFTARISQKASVQERKDMCACSRTCSRTLVLRLCLRISNRFIDSITPM